MLACGLSSCASKLRGLNNVTSQTRHRHRNSGARLTQGLRRVLLRGFPYPLCLSSDRFELHRWLWHMEPWHTGHPIGSEDLVGSAQLPGGLFSHPISPLHWLFMVTGHHWGLSLRLESLLCHKGSFTTSLLPAIFTTRTKSLDESQNLNI